MGVYIVKITFHILSVPHKFIYPNSFTSTYGHYYITLSDYQHAYVICFTIYCLHKHCAHIWPFFLQYQTNNIILISHRPPKKNIKAQNLLDGYPRAILFIPVRSALMVAESCVQLWFSTRVQRASSSGWPTSCMRAAGLDLLRLPTSPSTSICWVHFNMSSHRKPKPATRSLSNDMTNCWSFQPWHPNSLNQMFSKMKRPNWLKHTIKASIQMGITWPSQRQPGQMLKNKIIVLTCFQLCGY